MNEHDDLPVVFILFLFACSNPHKKKSEQPTNNDVWPKKATNPVDLWGCSPTSTVFIETKTWGISDSPWESWRQDFREGGIRERLPNYHGHPRKVRDEY